MRLITSILLWAFLSLPSNALEIQKLSDQVYALVGELNQRSPENLGNNATFGVVITGEGVVLIDAGGSWKGAQDIHQTIATITDQPVRFVINSGGQDHRWIGNGYWKTQGAQIIASSEAVADHKDRGSLQLTALAQLIGDALIGTEPAYADIEFDTNHTFDLGGMTFEIYYRGQAHTPGDSFVWLPSEQTVFSGDIVYIDRILGIGPQSHSGTWIEAFEAMAELNPTHLVPGHGPATDMLRATTDTYDYLTNIREKMGEYIDDGGEIIDSVGIDQSQFSYLLQFEQLAKRNAQQVYSEMEFE